jgi:hypothetical protein
MENKETEPGLTLVRQEQQDDTVPAEPESREAQLTRAITGLLDALDRCAGDPPDCPHCGPARSFALNLLSGPEVKAGEPVSEQERVVLAGRAGADPTFRTTPKGTLVGRFSLAVHGDDNSTTWFPVLAFNQRAERLREIVKRGAAVNVIGYVHTREAPSRDGTTRTLREIYAVSVTAPGTR